jgi:peptidyl-prolyl cis-trans isomerase A (cyclophilin A)
MNRRFLLPSLAAALVAGLSSATFAQSEAAAPAPDAKPAAPSASLADPSKFTEKAPDSFKVKFDTSVGSFTIEVTRALSPNGADRFYNLAKSGFFTDVAFFRVIEGFMCQFGIHGNPKVATAWRTANIQDDPVKASNTRGMVTFAKTGLPNSRSTQFFINFGDNTQLDTMGFSPFGKITEGMDVVDKIYKGYGEGAPRGNGPDQMRAQTEGNTYFKKEFPKLDYIKSATLVK